MRVANGLWFRFGAMRGHSEQSTSLQDVDGGEVLITTRAIYFSGKAKGVNFRLPFNQIMRFAPYADAVGICRNGAREQILAPQYIVWQDGAVSPAYSGWFLFNILQALATRDTAPKVSTPQPVPMGESAKVVAALLAGGSRLIPDDSPELAQLNKLAHEQGYTLLIGPDGKYIAVNSKGEVKPFIVDKTLARVPGCNHRTPQYGCPDCMRAARGQ